MSDSDRIELADRVYHLLGEATAHVPGECVTLLNEPDTEASRPSRVVRLVPKNPKSARLVAYVAAHDSVVEIVVGEDSRFELDVRARWRPLRGASFNEEIQALASAIADGAFTESLWIADGGIVNSEGTVSIRGREITTSARHFGRGSVGEAERRDIRYEPYRLAG